MYYQQGSFHQTDGKPICTLAELPVKHALVNKVYDGTRTGVRHGSGRLHLIKTIDQLLFIRNFLLKMITGIIMHNGMGKAGLTLKYAKQGAGCHSHHKALKNVNLIIQEALLLTMEILLLFTFHDP